MRLQPTASLLVLGALCAAGCERPAAVRGAGPADASPPSPVEAVQARAGTLPLVERLTGVVRAQNQVEIRAEVEAVVVEVLARSGEAVERGQPLVRLDDEALRHQLRQAEANVELEAASAREARARIGELQAQARRTRALVEDRLVSPLELEVLEAQLEGAVASAAAADARVDLARAQVEERRAALEKTVVRAPVAGRLGRRRVEAGALVGANTLLFQLGNLSEVVVEVPLTEAMLGYIHEGLPVRIEAPSLGGATLRAAVSRIPPFLATESLSTTAEIDVRQAGGALYPGMFVTVDVLYGESEEATLVPLSALWEDPVSGAPGVYVLEAPDLVAPASGEGVAPLSSRAYPATLRAVDELARGRDSVGVRGVAPGEWVVTLGQHLLAREGAQAPATVRPVPWERVVDLQGRHREDLLREFLERQQRIARERGARLPTTEEFLRGQPDAEQAPAQAPAAPEDADRAVEAGG